MLYTLNHHIPQIPPGFFLQNFKYRPSIPDSVNLGKDGVSQVLQNQKPVLVNQPYN